MSEDPLLSWMSIFFVSSGSNDINIMIKEKTQITVAS